MIVDAFGRSAANFQAAGYDGVEIHAGARLPRRAVPLAGVEPPHRRLPRRHARGADAPAARDRRGDPRRAAAPAIPVGIRLSADEETPGGLTHRRHARDRLRAPGRGARRLHLDHGRACAGRTSRTRPTPRASRSTWPAAVKQDVDVPVIAAGRIRLPGARRARARGGPGRLRRGRPRRDRRLRVGGEGARGPRGGDPAVRRHRAGLPRRARARRLRGQRARRAGGGVGEPPRRAAAPKRVVVAGGGPAGLEAARVAAESGPRRRPLRAGRASPAGSCGSPPPARPARSCSTSSSTSSASSRASASTCASETPRRARPCSPRARPRRQRDRRDAAAAGRSRSTAARASSRCGTCSAASVKEIPARAAVLDDGSGFWHGISAAEYLAERGAAVELLTPARGVGARDPARERRRRPSAACASNGVRFRPLVDRHRGRRIDGLARGRGHGRAVARPRPSSLVVRTRLRVDDDAAARARRRGSRARRRRRLLRGAPAQPRRPRRQLRAAPVRRGPARATPRMVVF